MNRAQLSLGIASALGIADTGRSLLWERQLEESQRTALEVRTRFDSLRTRGKSNATAYNVASSDPGPGPGPGPEPTWALRQNESLSHRVERRLEKIAARSSLNIFTRVFAHEALEEARKLDERLRHGENPGCLTGALVGVKDNLHIGGRRPSCGTRAFRCSVEAEALAIARLRSAGAIIIGATNLHALAYGPFSNSSDFGAVGNPLTPKVVAGGSSGGSAAAIAAGLADFSIGTDTAGSIRMPAALCSIVGHKPTYGLVPTEGAQPLARTLDHVGPLTRNVNDAKFVMRVLVGNLHEKTEVVDETRESSHRPKVGVPFAYIEQVLAPSARQSFQRTLENLRTAGVEVIPINVPQLDIAPSLLKCILGAEAFATFRKLLSQRGAQLPQDVRSRLESGMFITATDYIYAQELRDDLRRGLDMALIDVDALATPTLPIDAPTFEQVDGVVEGTGIPIRTAINRMTLPFNLTGHPAMSIPAGYDSNGAGIGLQLIGKRSEDLNLLSYAGHIETQLRKYLNNYV